MEREGEEMNRIFRPLFFVSILLSVWLVAPGVSLAATLEVGKASALAELTSGHEYEAPAEHAVAITIDLESGGTSPDSYKVVVGGVTVAKGQLLATAEHDFGGTFTVIVPAKAKWEVQFGTTAVHQYSQAELTVPTVPGAEGKEGKEGKEGPKGTTGEKGTTGATGPEGPKGTTGTTGPEGKEGKSFVWKSVYSSSTTYGIMEVVEYKGSSYDSVKAENKGNTPGTSEEYWNLVAKEGAEGKEGKEGKEGVAGHELTSFGTPASEDLSEIKETGEVVGFCIIGTMLALALMWALSKVLSADRK